MTVDEKTASAIFEIECERKRYFWLSVMWSMAFVAAFVATLCQNEYFPVQPDVQLFIFLGLAIVIAYIAIKGLATIRGYSVRGKLLLDYNAGREALSNAIICGTAAALKAQIDRLKTHSNVLLKSLLEAQEGYLQSVVTARCRAEGEVGFRRELNRFKESYQEKALELRNRHPLFRAHHALSSAAEYLKQRRSELDAQWKDAYESFSWWNKVCYGNSPDFKELDSKIRELEVANRSLLRKHGEDFQRLKTYYGEMAERAFKRVTHASIQIETYIKQRNFNDSIGDEYLRRGLFFAAMSVPISMWTDLNKAGDVYDTLRSVNGNYQGLSDSEIWWETLFLPSESLAGLIGLTKGAYLESLVASDSGGALFEHFNHPETDIVIDGVSFQIKATDSESYINSVSDGIPVIATSEVADVTGAIDSGYSNEELQEVISLAIGGSVIDVGDTAVDAVLTGVGALGVFATIDGINHALKEYEKGGDPVEAMFDGAGVAIEGTARAAVNTLELGYNLLNSRPSRFVGRTLLKGAIALDKKLFESADNRN